MVYDGFLGSIALPSLVAVFAALGPIAARGQTTSSLSWSRLPGAESCIGAGELARRVEERLGRPALVSPSQADRSVEGRVSPREGGGWQANLALAERDGSIISERALETREPDCRALDSAVVLVIALLIDPEGTPAPPPERSPSVIIREVVREVRVREPWGLGVRSGVGVEQGALPGVAWAGLLGLALDPPGVPPVELSGFATMAASREADLPARDADLRMAGAALAMCPAFRPWLRACGGGRLTWLRWRGDGFETVESGRVLVPAIGAEGRVELPLGERFRLVAAGGAWLPLRRITVTYQLSPSVSGDVNGASENLFRAAPVSCFAGLGIAVRIF